MFLPISPLLGYDATGAQLAPFLTIHLAGPQIMQLKWFRVREFQSVRDSGPVKTDDIVCLVGKMNP